MAWEILKRHTRAGGEVDLLVHFAVGGNEWVRVQARHTDPASVTALLDAIDATPKLTRTRAG